MHQREIHVPPGGPPDVQRPSERIFPAMGEDAIRRMIHDFYSRLYASPIRGLFPDDMDTAAEKSADYFIGLLGGPPIYHAKHGPPMLRARHLPFKIDEPARAVWVDCFMQVLDGAVDAYGFPQEHLQGFREFLSAFSFWMVNTHRPD